MKAEIKIAIQRRGTNKDKDIQTDGRTDGRTDGVCNAKMCCKLSVCVGDSASDTFAYAFAQGHGTTMVTAAALRGAI